MRPMDSISFAMLVTRPKWKATTAMGEALERFVGSVEERGFLPMRLFFAAKRYRRWARINLEATIPARASTHQEIYETYNLGRLQEAYPEVRARFFQETVFRESDRPAGGGLGRYRSEATFYGNWRRTSSATRWRIYAPN